MESMTKLDDLCVKKGLVPAAGWGPLAGPNNTFIYEFDYPDFSTFEKEQEQFYSDKGIMDAFRSSGEHVIQGTGRSELLQSLYDIE
ncbi:MAG: hypothetical protein QOC87_524 [Actinomycetota bacterium]|jgi:hypothetical protein|nr:hypothetical protein [Actinomycetota bacterium]